MELAKGFGASPFGRSRPPALLPLLLFVAASPRFARRKAPFESFRIELKNGAGERIRRFALRAKSATRFAAAAPVCRSFPSLCSAQSSIRILSNRVKKWSWRKDSNLQPMVYKTIALPLSYASLVERVNGIEPS